MFRRQHPGRTWVRLSTFNKHRIKGCWYPSGRFFVIPLDDALNLAEAIAVAASGEPPKAEPDWYGESEREYEALRR